MSLALVDATAPDEGYWHLNGQLSGAAAVRALTGLAHLHAPDTGSRCPRHETFALCEPGILRSTAWTLPFIAFAIKVGLAPLHIWMPRGYAKRPPGYLPWRTLDLCGRPRSGTPSPS